MMDVSIVLSAKAFTGVDVKAYHSVLVKDEWFIFASYTSVRLSHTLSLCWVLSAELLIK